MNRNASKLTTNHLHIFAGRDMDYFECAHAVEVQQRSLELIESDRYDVISIHTFDYDNAAHAYGPESKEGLNAIALEAEGFRKLAEALEKYKGKHRALSAFLRASPSNSYRSPRSTCRC